MSIKHVLTCLVCLLFVSVPTYAIDLVDACNSAFKHNTTYLGHMYDSLAINDALGIAFGARLPQVLLSANANENNIYINNVDFAYYQPSLSASINVPIVDFNRLDNYKQAKLDSVLSFVQLEYFKQRLMLDVAGNYFTVLRLNDKLNTINMMYDTLENHYKDAQARYVAGVGNKLDVLTLVTKLDLLKTKKLDLYTSIVNSQNKFNTITHLNANFINPMNETIDVDSINNALKLHEFLESNTKYASDYCDTHKPLCKIAYSHNIDILLLQNQLHSAYYAIQSSKDQHLPVIGASVAYQLMGTSTTNLTSYSASASTLVNILQNIPGLPMSSYSQVSAGLVFSMPLFLGGSLNAQTQISIDRYDALNEKMLQLKRELSYKLGYEMQNLQNDMMIIDVKKKLCDFAQVKLQGITQSYKIGARSNLEVMEAIKNYYQYYEQYRDAQYDYMQDILQIAYLTGNLNANLIHIMNLNIKNN